MNRQQRRAAELEKYAAKSRPEKIAMLVGSAVLATVTALLVGYLLSGEWRVGFSIAMGLVIAATTAFMYRSAW